MKTLFSNIRFTIFFTITFLSVVLPSGLSAQIDSRVEGYLLDASTKKPLAFANIWNVNRKTGTATALNGYFRLSADGFEDTIAITYVGYKTRFIVAKEISAGDTVLLTPAIINLDQVAVYANDNFLYSLVLGCKEQAQGMSLQASTYYQLETYYDNEQVELVEMYFNGKFNGYNIEELNYKEGRLALKKFNDQFFISLESSKAIYAVRLFERNAYLPENPFEIYKSDLRKKFILSLNNRYVTETGNTIYVIDFEPAKNVKSIFSGRVWIDSVNENMLKINLRIKDTKRHPFLPLWKADTLKQVDLDITETFVEQNGRMFFEHIDYNYEVLYKSGVDSVYTVSTKAYLTAYDYTQSFILPHFDWQEDLSDYRKITSVPFNSSFWENNLNFKLSDFEKRNELFFNDEKIAFNSNHRKHWPVDVFGRTFFEAPYMLWNKNRIGFIFAKNDGSNDSQSDKSKHIDLKIQFYLDVHKEGDSLKMMSAAIFDPYKSRYLLELNDLSNCLLNMYFDIAEIARRKFDDKCRSKGMNVDRMMDELAVAEKYLKTNGQLFLKEVDEGSNRENMEIWNRYIYKELKIDNLDFFKPYNN